MKIKVTFSPAGSSVQRLNIIRQYLMAKTMRNSMKHAEHDGIKTSRRYCDIKIFSRLGAQPAYPILTSRGSQTV